jgi:hypothetical protein
MTLKPEVAAEAAGIWAGSKEEFFQGHVVGWDPRMKEGELVKYLQKKRLKTQAEVASVLMRDMPLGRHTAGETIGTELLVACASGRVDLTNVTWTLRNESFLEGIDSATVISSWSENAYHAGANRWQSEMQAGTGPWAPDGNKWLSLFYTALPLAHMGKDRNPTVSVFFGFHQSESALKQLNHDFSMSFRVILALNAAVGRAAQQAEMERAVQAYRANLGFPNNTRDIRMQMRIDPENAFEGGVAGNYRFLSTWNVERLSINTARAGPGGVGGNAVLRSTSLGDGFQTDRALLVASEIPPIVALACRLLNQSTWLTGYAFPDASGGDTGVELRCRGGGAEPRRVREGAAQLFRYFDTMWAGTGVTNRALYAAAARMVSAAGVDPANLQATAVDVAWRGLRADDVMNVQGLSCFRHHTARTRYENGSLNPLAVWAVENKKVVLHDAMRPQFNMTPTGILETLKRLATLLTIFIERAMTSVALPGLGTMYGCGWSGHAEWDNETGHEMVVALERAHQHGWNEEFGKSLGMTVRFDMRGTNASTTGHNLMDSAADTILCLQRIPTWAYAVYTSNPYLPEKAPPTLGSPIFVRANSGAVLADRGTYYDITSMQRTDQAVFSTLKGGSEDDVSTPYPIAMMINGRFHKFANTPMAIAIDNALVDARVHNRGMSVVPFIMYGLGETVQYQLVVKARSPPQSGGLVCIGHNCIPQWAADAPAHGRVVVEAAHLAAAGDVMRFRQ